MKIDMDIQMPVFPKFIRVGKIGESISLPLSDFTPEQLREIAKEMGEAMVSWSKRSREM